MARVPFVVDIASVGVRASRYSRGELPRSNPSILTPSRSPPSVIAAGSTCSARASSTSAAHSTRSYPDASAWQIVDVARITSTTTPVGAAADSSGVNAT